MELVCMGWVAVVVLALLARAGWKGMEAVAAWQPRPRNTVVPPPPPPPPEPTPQEKAAAARERYAARIEWLEAAGLDEIELRAGKLKAKQSYLETLDGIP